MREAKRLMMEPEIRRVCNYAGGFQVSNHL